MLKGNKIKHLRWILSLLICNVLISACSNDRQKNIKLYLQSEFIQTYNYVTKNNHLEKDISAAFEKMIKTNSDAFSSIAYRWHNLAMRSCDLSSTSNLSQTRKSSYEKLLKENSNELNTMVISSKDRDCLADVYLSHWQQINDMLALNFPYPYVNH